MTWSCHRWTLPRHRRFQTREVGRAQTITQLGSAKPRVTMAGAAVSRKRIDEGLAGMVTTSSCRSPESARDPGMYLDS